MEVGPRDIASESVFVARRDRSPNDKKSVPRKAFIQGIAELLADIQKSLFDRALAFQKAHTVTIDNAESFKAFFTPQNNEKPEIHGGFALSHWCGSENCEAKIKQDQSVTIRCIPVEGEAESSTCICCGRPSSRRVVYAKAY